MTGPYLPGSCDVVIYNHVWRRFGRGRVFVARLPEYWIPDPLDAATLTDQDRATIEGRGGLLAHHTG
jgi:hypothetical protein